VGYPAASRTAQWFYDTVGGANMGAVEKVVWHTTETTGWPAYDGGKKAPHYTVRPDFGAQRMLWRQHFPDHVNARAMRNEPGGVQTNLDGALQVEIVGTCDETRTWAANVLRSWDLEDWQVEGLAMFVAWAHRVHGVPLLAPSLWLAYGKDPRAPGRVPASYGDSPARMAGGTWDRFRGHCGHQHAPENSHGDPGRLPMGQILARGAFLLAPPTDKTEDDDMTPQEFLKLLTEAELPLGEANADLLGQKDGRIKVGELLVATAGHSAATNRLLVKTNYLLHELIALHKPAGP
jgi:hypothetical protein